MKRVIKIIEKLLLYGLFALGITLLFFDTGRISTMILAFESFIAAIMIAWFFEFKKIDGKYLIFIYLALWLNMFGELFAYYDGGFLYDKFLHLALGILLTSITLEYYKQNSSLKKDAVFLTVLGMLALWEIYEFFLDSFFGFQAQGVFYNGLILQSALEDTMHDLIWGSIGSIGFLFFKKEKIDVVVKKTIKKEEIKFSTFIRNFFKW
ncbi:MAG: hypothetical protein Q8L27_01800 [archaeon]|nr:hypothetical protein [archaeon]